MEGSESSDSESISLFGAMSMSTRSARSERMMGDDGECMRSGTWNASDRLGA